MDRAALRIEIVVGRYAVEVFFFPFLQTDRNIFIAFHPVGVHVPIAVTTQFKARGVFGRSELESWVYVHVFHMFVLSSVGRSLTMAFPSPVQAVLSIFCTVHSFRS
jgi:hypothetical protein